MAITNCEDAITGIMEKLIVGTERCYRLAEHIESDKVKAELDTLALQIDLVKKAVRELVTSTGYVTLLPPDCVTNEPGAVK